MKKIGIIGGGINGLFISWELRKIGLEVDLYESKEILKQTSSASSKLIHGGIRYLEQGHLSLVKQSLIDRAWWIENAPAYCKPIKICMPVYKGGSRSLLKLYAGVTLYKFLAGKHSLGKNDFYGVQEGICDEGSVENQTMKIADVSLDRLHRTPQHMTTRLSCLRHIIY